MDYFILDDIEYDKSYADIKMAVNIPALCSAKHFCYRKVADSESDLTENCVTFVRPIKFQENAKYIMLSATANKKICEYCFGEDNVTFYDCKEAEIRGTLNQYGDKPMGRRSIRKDPSIFAKINKWTGIKNTISFKEFHEHYVGDLHFGSCSGYDSLKGKDINIIFQLVHICRLMYDDLKSAYGILHNGTSLFRRICVSRVHHAAPHPAVRGRQVKRRMRFLT